MRFLESSRTTVRSRMYFDYPVDILSIVLAREHVPMHRARRITSVMQLLSQLLGVCLLPQGDQNSSLRLLLLVGHWMTPLVVFPLDSRARPRRARQIEHSGSGPIGWEASQLVLWAILGTAARC